MIKSRLKVVLAERNMSMKKLAEMAGLHYTTINRFEKDERELISRKTLDTVCKALDVQPGDLFVYVPIGKGDNE